MFVVGDEKQSIFSFQRADPREFARAHARIAERHEAAGRAFETIPLDTSFRSVSAVLAAVDGVFARPEAREGVTAEPTVHHVSPRRARDGGPAGPGLSCRRTRRSRPGSRRPSSAGHQRRGAPRRAGRRDRAGLDREGHHPPLAGSADFVPTTR